MQSLLYLVPASACGRFKSVAAEFVDDTLPLRGPHYLSKGVGAGLVGSGGQAKHLIREGKVQVNGAVETHPGRKLVAGDRFQAEESPEWQVSTAEL